MMHKKEVVDKQLNEDLTKIAKTARSKLKPTKKMGEPTRK